MVATSMPEACATALKAPASWTQASERKLCHAETTSAPRPKSASARPCAALPRLATRLARPSAQKRPAAIAAPSTAQLSDSPVPPCMMRLRSPGEANITAAKVPDMPWRKPKTPTAPVTMR
jgi:hypothetical protein